MDTKGYIYREGVAPQTHTIISTKNKIYGQPAGQSDFKQIGVIASFEPSDSRAVEAIYGIGYGDQVAELIPNVSDPITVSVTRSALYLALLMQTFGYNSGVDGLVRALKHHRWPFDVKQEIVFSELDTKGTQASGAVQSGNYKALLTFYEACWMTSYSWSFAADTALVQENCEMSCSDIVDGKTNYHNFSQIAFGTTDTGNNPSGGKGFSRRFAGTI